MNGEMPKPHGYLFERCEFMYPDMLDKEVIDDPTTLAVYTADQMRAFAQEAARQAMERAAQICDARRQASFERAQQRPTIRELEAAAALEAGRCAFEIRALIPQDPDHLAGVGNMVDGKDQSEERHG